MLTKIGPRRARQTSSAVAGDGGWILAAETQDLASAAAIGFALFVLALVARSAVPTNRRPQSLNHMQSSRVILGSRTNVMPSRHQYLVTAILLLSLLSCSQPGHPHRTSATLPHQLDLLRPLHEQLGPPRPGDWLLSHDEPGQTFAEWRARSPIMARGKRRSIYIQPIGAFTKSERRIVELTSEFMQCYFQRPVYFLPDLPEERIPEEARRVHPSWGDQQILTTYVLHEVLAPSLPDDAAALIAFTATDLWPGDNWNYVFGQASLRARVGVWSIHRNGDPTASEAAFRLCLLRTCKTATHETGHMFSMAHCTAYECNMCGSNNRDESDRHPLPCCPECVAKICHATDSEPLPRFEALAAFCKTHGLGKAETFYKKSIDALRH